MSDVPQRNPYASTPSRALKRGRALARRSIAAAPVPQYWDVRMPGAVAIDENVGWAYDASHSFGFCRIQLASHGSVRHAVRELADSSLVSKLAAVSRELESVRSELSSLRDQVSDIETFVGKTGTVSDPFLDWCDANLDKLAALPRAYVAIDPEKGILFYDSDQRIFGEKLAKLSREDRKRTFSTHTSQYK